jgi:hypothetical protein
VGREGGEAKVVFMQKKAGKLLRQEGSDCIFEADSPGQSIEQAPNRRWKECVHPSELPASDEPMSCSMTGVWIQHMDLSVTQG